MYIYKHTGCPTKITPCLEGRSKQGVIFCGTPCTLAHLFWYRCVVRHILPDPAVDPENITIIV